MRFTSLTRRLGAASAATAAALVALMAPLPSTAPASAQPSGCADVDVLFGRGTSEAPGIGRVGQAFVDALQAGLGGRTLTTYAINYPATYDFLGAADGANDATAHISSVAAQCPSTRFVIGGYSQGAAIVDMLAGVPPLGNKVGEVGSAPPLPSSLNGNVAAVVAFGNPSTKFGIPLTSSIFGGRAVDMCADGDPICSDGRNPFAHTSYERGPMPADAAAYVLGRL